MPIVLLSHIDVVEADPKDWTLGPLLAAIPFGFAVRRAAGTGTDFRYVWVALVLGFAICEAGGLSLVQRARSG